MAISSVPIIGNKIKLSSEMHIYHTLAIITHIDCTSQKLDMVSLSSISLRLMPQIRISPY